MELNKMEFRIHWILYMIGALFVAAGVAGFIASFLWWKKGFPESKSPYVAETGAAYVFGGQVPTYVFRGLTPEQGANVAGGGTGYTTSPVQATTVVPAQTTVPLHAKVTFVAEVPTGAFTTALAVRDNYQGLPLHVVAGETQWVAQLAVTLGHTYQMVVRCHDNSASLILSATEVTSDASGAVGQALLTNTSTQVVTMIVTKQNSTAVVLRIWRGNVLWHSGVTVPMTGTTLDIGLGVPSGVAATTVPRGWAMGLLMFARTLTVDEVAATVTGQALYPTNKTTAVGLDDFTNITLDPLVSPVGGYYELGTLQPDGTVNNDIATLTMNPANGVMTGTLATADTVEIPFVGSTLIRSSQLKVTVTRNNPVISPLVAGVSIAALALGTLMGVVGYSQFETK